MPGTVVVLLPALILGATPSAPSLDLGPLRFAGVLLVALGLFVAGWAVLGFVIEGRGTPAPYDPPRRLVSGRLYARVRNPMYLGGTLILVGEAVLFRSYALLAYAALVWLGWHLFVVLYEEPTLRRRFGAAYDEYRARVPRWLPRLR